MAKKIGQTRNKTQNGNEIPFSTIIGLAHEAIVVIDEEQNLILVNQGAEQVFGYAASEVIGKPLDILLPLGLSEIHRAHVNNFSSASDSARYMHQRREITGRRKNGDIFPAEASIVKVSDSKRNIFAAILRDVTYRREIESQQATFSHAIDQTGDIVFITDQKGVIEYVNPTFEEVTGYAKAEALGQTPRILKSGMMPEEYYQQVWQTIMAGGIVRAEVLDRRKSGDLFYYDQTISPLKDSQGRITHFVSTGKDVTLRKRTEQELQLLLKLTQAIAEAESFDSALTVTLKLVCESVGWDFGQVWIPSRDGAHLELGAPYYSKFDDVESFRRISSQFEFRPGIGLPGRVWSSGQPAWIADVTADGNFPRAAYAREAGLKAAIGIPVPFKTAVGIPVMAGSAVVTVLEFFVKETRQEDERMMLLSSAISTQLGTAFQRKQSEEILKQSETRLREAQRIAKMGNWELDLLTNELIWSDEIFCIFEIDKERFGASYAAFLDLIHPEDREAVNQAYTDSLKTRQPYEITHRLLMSDGRVKYVEERCENFFAADGAPIRSVGLVQDITERKQAEEALQEKEELFRTMAQNSSDLIAMTDENDLLLYASPQCENILGYSGDEFIGKIMPYDIHPDDAAQAAEIWQQVKTGSEVRDFEYRIIDAQGQVRWLSHTAKQVSVNGKVLGIQSTIKDITERKQAEAALRESEERYRLILENSMDAILLTAPDGKVLSANQAACAMFQRTEEEIRQLGRGGLVDLTDPRLPALLEERARTGKATGELAMVRRDGSKFPVEISSSVFKDSGGALNTSMIIRDITERKRAEEDLRTSEEKFKTIFNESPLGIALINSLTGQFEAVNPMHAKIMGRSMEEMVTIDWMSTTHPDDVQRDQDLMELMLSGQIGGYQMEKRHMRPDGSIFWINLTVVPVNVKDKKYPVHLAMMEDITERKQAAETLRVSEEKYRTVADFTYDWEAWRGLDGAYLYVSPACERITGHTMAEFLADPDLVLKIAHPHDQPKVLEHRHEVAHQAQRHPLEFDFRIITPSGETRWIGHSCIPVYGKNGDFLGRRENNRDITARKRAELQLQDSQQRLREIVDAAPFGAHVYQLNENNQLLFVDANQSADAILEVDNSIFIGKTLEDAFPTLVETELPDLYRRVAQKGYRYDIPQFNYRDERLFATLEIHVIQIAQGRIAVFFRNITELVKAYDETIVGWSRAMDFRDRDTEDHTQRVTSMTVELARVMDVDETELAYIRWGALLHDIGKIGIPDSVLLKSGKLTEEELLLMHKHVEFAYDMLYPIHFLRPALDIPYCHHEKWDGTGYPRGLKGEEIPLPARIFALVDVWDALRSDRPYRQQWPREKVIEHIRALAGTHFDPTIADMFLDFIDKSKT